MGAGAGQPHRRAHRLQRRARAADRDPVRDPARRRSRRQRDHARRPRGTGARSRSPPTEAAPRVGAGRDTRRRWPPSSPTLGRPAGRPDGHDLVRPPAGSRSLVVCRPRGGASRSRSAPSPTSSSSRSSSPSLCQRAELRAVGRSVRDPRPGGVPARIATSARSCSTATRSSTGSIRVPADAALLIVDSGVARSLENTAYAERRAELEHALRLVGRRPLHRGRAGAASTGSTTSRRAGCGTS